MSSMSGAEVRSATAFGVPLSGSPPASELHAAKQRDPAHVALRVCVIGSGPAGIVSVKEVMSAGHHVTCFEANSGPGGVFGDSRQYEDCQLVSSNLVTAFSDFTFGDQPMPVQKIWTFKEYMDYMSRYSRFHGLLSVIQFKTLVTRVRKDERSGKWIVSTRKNDVQNVFNLEAKGADSNAWEPTDVDTAFDRVIVCSGLHQRPRTPAWKGIETFNGKIMHHFNVKDSQAFKDKRVLVVGGGESAGDMALLVSRVAAASAISIRRFTGFMVSRYDYLDKQGKPLADAAPSDRDTGRALHMNARVGHFIWQMYSIFLWVMATLVGDPINAWIFKWNIKQYWKGAHWWNNYGTKNASIPISVIHHGLTIHSDVARIQDNRVHFADGTFFDADLIVCSTGWFARFPFLERDHADVAAVATKSSNLYRRMLTTRFRDELFFIGFTRPAFGAMPPLADLHARWAALLISKKKTLPTNDEMERIIKRDDQRNVKQYLSTDYRVIADFLIQTTTLAEEIGCRPNLVRMLFSDPKLWWKTMTTPLIGASWRLEGPGALPQWSRQILLASPSTIFAPFYLLLNTVFTSWYLIGYRLLCIPYFKQYKPATLFEPL